MVCGMSGTGLGGRGACCYSSRCSIALQQTCPEVEVLAFDECQQERVLLCLWQGCYPFLNARG